MLLLSNKNQLNWLLWVVAILAAAIGKYHHELWLDECHVIGIVRESNSLAELWRNKACDGHPILYYLIFYPFRHIGNQVLVSIILHMLMVAWMYYLLLIRCKLPLYLNLLLVCSVVLMYEYSVINRPYVLFASVMLYTAIALRDKTMSIAKLIFCVTVLCQLVVYGAPISAAFCIYFYLTNRNNLKFVPLAMLGLAVAFNFVLLYASIDLPADSMTHWLKPKRGPATWTLQGVATYFHYGYFALHNWGSTKWNDTRTVNLTLSTVFMLIILLYCIITTQNNKVRLFYVLATVGLMILNLEADLMTLRHMSFYFMVYLCAYILLSEQSKEFKFLNFSMPLHFILLPFLATQAVYGIHYYATDLRTNFSLAKNMTALLVQDGHTRHAIAGHGDMSIGAPSTYLQKKIYNIRTNELAYTSRWDKFRSLGPEAQDTLDLMRECNLLLAKHDTLILIVDDDMHLSSHRKMLDSLTKNTAITGVQKMPEFLGAMMPREQFYLYKLYSLGNK
ncbi:MAG: hypothetical protein RL660_119 [Bacteroidota bacterium]|jgi:hypothetical protein